MKLKVALWEDDRIITTRAFDLISTSYLLGQFPIFSFEKDVNVWCRESFGYAPRPIAGVGHDDYLDIHINFRRKQDAIAFKLRWL